MSTNQDPAKAEKHSLKDVLERGCFMKTLQDELKAAAENRDAARQPAKESDKERIENLRLRLIYEIEKRRSLRGMMEQRRDALKEDSSDDDDSFKCSSDWSSDSSSARVSARVSETDATIARAIAKQLRLL